MLQRSFARVAQRGFAQSNLAVSQRFFSTGLKLYGPSGETAHTIFDTCVKKPVPAEGEKPEKWSPKDAKKVAAGLEVFAQYYQDNSDLREFLSDTEKSPEDKDSTLEEHVYKEMGIGSTDEDNIVKDAVVLIMTENQLDILDGVVADFKMLVADANGEVSCTVTSATDLSKAQAKQVEAKINGMLEKGQKALITWSTDPSLLGGLTVDVGGKFQDISAASAIRQGADALRAM